MDTSIPVVAMLIELKLLMVPEDGRARTTDKGRKVLEGLPGGITARIAKERSKRDSRRGETTKVKLRTI